MAIVKKIASEEYADEKALYEANEAIKNIPQSDWNQNDETAADFIKNRPFYDIKVSSIIYDGQIDFSQTYDGDGLYGTYYDAEVSFEEGHIYNAIFNNENNEFVCQEAVCEQDGFLTLHVQDSDFYVEIFSYDSIYIFSANPEYFDYDIFEEGLYNLKVAEIETTPKTLDEKFIPDTIARIKNIPQSDWNQSDENAIDFIKNKPFYDIKVSNIIYNNLVDFTEIYDQVNYLEGTLDEGISCKKGHIYNAIFNNENNEFVCQEVVCDQDGYLTMPVQDYDYYVEIVDGYQISIRTNSEEYFDSDIFEQGAYNFKIAEIETTPKTLDEKFIPDTIARRKDVLQSDWEQHDENAIDHIKNKPFYDINVSSIIYDGQVEFSQLRSGEGLEGTLEKKDLCKKGNTYKVILNYNAIFDDGDREFVCQEAVCDRDGFLTSDFDFQGYYYWVKIIDDYIKIFSLSSFNFDYDIFKPGTYNLKIEENRTAFKTLDEKFIPDTIARTSQIPSSNDFVTSINGQTGDVTIEIPQIEYPVTSVNGQTGDVTIEIPQQVQPDWNQNDENAVDFIKNKPFYDINVSSIICDDKVDFEQTFGGVDGLQGTLLEGTLDERVPCKKGDTYKAIFNNKNNEFVCQEVVCEQDGYLTMPIQDYDYYVEIADGYKISIHTNSEYFDFDIFEEDVYNFTITEIETAFKALDEKFIPDTIARKEDIPTKVSELTNDSGYLTSYTETDPTVPAWAKAATKPTYTASEVGADASGTASSAISAHNANISAHADIREQIDQLFSEKLDKTSVLQNTGNSETDVMSQKAVTAALENLTTLPYGGSKEWLENNGDVNQLYQIDGYVWGYIESTGWTKSGTQFLVVSSESEMTNSGGTAYLLRRGDEGTVYTYTEASGDSNVSVVDSIPDTANNGDIITVKPTEVSSIAEMTDTSKQYAMGGMIWESRETTSVVEPQNKFVPSTASINQRLSGSSGSVSSNDTSKGSFVTDFIAVSNVDSISPYIMRLNWEMPLGGDNKIVYFNSSKTRLGNTVFASSSAYASNTTVANGKTVIDIKTMGDSSPSQPSNWVDVAYIRLQLFVKPSRTSITSDDIANLTITFDAEKTTTTEPTWVGTGLSVGRKYEAYVSETEVTWTDIGTYVEPTEASWDATAETHDIIDSLSTTASNGTSAVYSGDGYVYTYISGSAWMQMSKYSAPTLAIDGELSLTSKNAVQNKAVAVEIDALKANDENLSADIEYILNTIAEIETGTDSVSVPTFWQDALDECIAKIKALQVGRNCVTFPFFSDNHQRNGYAGLLISEVMKACHIPYCFFGGDSISSGKIADEDTMIAQDKAFDASMSYIPNGRLCRAVGNHDGYWYDGTNKYYYTREQVYELFLREEAIAQNKHFGDDGTYYYVDDIASKVRWIILNTNGGSVDSTQIAWVQNTALNLTENGWGVVFISHQPISNHYHAGISNAGAVVTAVVETATTKNVPIIGWYSGHVHRDIIATKLMAGGNGSNAGTETTDLGFTQVIITSDHTGIAYDDATKHTVAADDQSHAIDFVTINRATRTVNITRLGIGEDRSYSY